MNPTEIQVLQRKLSFKFQTHGFSVTNFTSLPVNDNNNTSVIRSCINTEQVQVVEIKHITRTKNDMSKLVQALLLYCIFVENSSRNKWNENGKLCNLRVKTVAANL